MLSVLLCAVILVGCASDGTAKTTSSNNENPSKSETANTDVQNNLDDTTNDTTDDTADGQNTVEYVPYRYEQGNFSTTVSEDMPHYAISEKEAVRYAELHAYKELGDKFDLFDGKASVISLGAQKNYYVNFNKNYGHDGFIYGPFCRITMNPVGVFSDISFPNGDIPSDFDESTVADLTEEEVYSALCSHITNIFGEINETDHVGYSLENLGGRYVIEISLEFSIGESSPSDAASKYAKDNYFEIHPHGLTHDDNHTYMVFANFIYDIETRKINDEMTLRYAQLREKEDEAYWAKREAESAAEQAAKKEEELRQLEEETLEDERKFGYLNAITNEELLALELAYPAPDSMTVHFGERKVSFDRTSEEYYIILKKAIKTYKPLGNMSCNPHELPFSEVEMACVYFGSDTAEQPILEYVYNDDTPNYIFGFSGKSVFVPVSTSGDEVMYNEYSFGFVRMELNDHLLTYFS